MYDELVKQLREKHQAYVATYNAKSGQIFKDAADAIEELAKESERWKAEAKDWYLAYMDLLPIREESEEEDEC